MSDASLLRHCSVQILICRGLAKKCQAHLVNLIACFAPFAENYQDQKKKLFLSETLDPDFVELAQLQCNCRIDRVCAMNFINVLGFFSGHR